ncbi:hypothetical protein ACOKFD_04760 [Flagellimonas sp. S174]|uniref:hypothetical protein n=1 Tax=Flagellimonas sp. S174 TaxID=3410790 RepID=UPI003BF4CD05
MSYNCIIEEYPTILYRLLFPLFMLSAITYSQQISLDRLGKDGLFNYSGGITTNAVFYNGTANRQNLTYVLSGNLNLNIADVYNVPLSFVYSNQEFTTPNPFNFNRLSLSPSYKWITLHVGSSNLSFSQYTLNNHQFDGVGLELAPKGPFNIAMMYGRFLKATEYDPENPNALVAYKRMGYGLNASYKFEKVLLGLSVFKAKDDDSSLQNPVPFELDVAPADNMVISLNSEFSVWEKAQFQLEYAISGITENVRLDEERNRPGLFSFLLDENVSTQYHQAFNASVNYPTANGSLGLGYERVDPNYKTFGAYFFNNDLENITVNANQTIFNNTLNVGVNVGLQRDNLDNTKLAEMKRLVSALNLSYTASEKLNLNGSYSNFQSFTNVRDQFDYINQANDFETLDTLNYRQVSQNANLGINYNFQQSEVKRQSLTINLLYQQSKNEQEGQEAPGGDNAFYNGSVALSLGYPERDLVITPATNVSYNTIGLSESQWIVGPTLGISKQFFEKKLRTNFSTSYNATIASEMPTRSNFNFRLGGNYAPAEDHMLRCNIISLLRNGTENNQADVTVTLGYTYSFSNKKQKRKEPDNSMTGTGSKARLSFRHQGTVYRGSTSQVSAQLINLWESRKGEISHADHRETLLELLREVNLEKDREIFKIKAVAFLDALAQYTQTKERNEK